MAIFIRSKSFLMLLIILFFFSIFNLIGGNEVKWPHLATEKCGEFSVAGNHMSSMKFITLERSKIKHSQITTKLIAVCIDI